MYQVDSHKIVMTQMPEPSNTDTMQGAFIGSLAFSGHVPIMSTSTLLGTLLLQKLDGSKNCYSFPQTSP